MFECPECGHLHDEPGDARLGFVVPCLGCLIVIEIAADDMPLYFLPAA